MPTPKSIIQKIVFLKKKNPKQKCLTLIKKLSSLIYLEINK